MMKRYYGCVHAFAECEDCSWTTNSHKNGQAIAAKHAAKHHHKVTGELGITFGYDGRGDA